MQAERRGRTCRPAFRSPSLAQSRAGQGAAKFEGGGGCGASPSLSCLEVTVRGVASSRSSQYVNVQREKNQSEGDGQEGENTS